MKAYLKLLLLVYLLGGTLSHATAYDYPFKDPYVATIIGTPEEFEAKVPEKISYEILSLKVFPDRVVPEVFWYQRKFRYSMARQEGEAPLIFIIAGTGNGFDSSGMIFLQKAYYQAGFHVICLSSPTHMNFITTASRTSLPGNIYEDAEDLYRVMAMAWEHVKGRIKISEFYLTGYSLGASEAAFIAKLDEEKHTFDFKKVLMINPPVSLYSSAKILDNLLLRALPGGINDFDDWLERILDRFVGFYRTMGYLDLTNEYLYDVYRTIYKSKPPLQDDMATMIGTAFRIASDNMIFTSDVMTNSGLIVPKNRVLGSADSLTDYFKVVGQVSFADYFNELLLPNFKAKYPGLTKERAIEIMDLRSIEAYLRDAGKIALMTNEDDLILTPEDLAFLKHVFGPRAQIFPYGGHCGNMSYTENVEFMIGFFKN